MNTSMTAATSDPRVDWDYTAHASHYDKRADYSAAAIDELLTTIGCTPSKPVADIGAGTGKFTKELLKRGLSINAVEPNEAMREIGMGNTHGGSVTWLIGTGEATGLADASVYAAFFGSSFNVVDQRLALAEVARILMPRGWFACMWNHRDLQDPVQQHIEAIIRAHIPDYSYGSRREDPSGVIEASDRFSAVRSIERRFLWEMPRADIIVAWKSHATLKRQAGSETVFDGIIVEISRYLELASATLAVPYATRIYYAQLIN